MVRDKQSTHSFRRWAVILLAVGYALAASLCGYRVTTHTTLSTNAIEQILLAYNMKNEGAEALARYSKDHPILTMLFGGPVKSELNLPSEQEAQEKLYTEVKHQLKTVRAESSIAAWWSWTLLSLSLFYLVATIAVERTFTARPVLFALTTICLMFFFIGILAPAMVIWTAPIIPLQSGNLEFVVQHQVRGIAAIIWDLLTGGHYVIGGFLLLFSIVTPLTKATLTYVVTMSKSKALNVKIGEFLHTIGKWSMADVFVAAVLLALYALKFQEATKSVPCLGLYYFTGYCLLSLTTTELMVHSDAVGRGERSRLRLSMIGILFAGFIAFAGASGIYTYEQYTLNTKEPVRALGEPSKLNNADLVLPAHQK